MAYETLRFSQTKSFANTPSLHITNRSDELETLKRGLQSLLITCAAIVLHRSRGPPHTAAAVPLTRPLLPLLVFLSPAPQSRAL